MEKFIIEGGQPLSGTLTPAGNKNAALPALAASLLTSEEVVLRNVPRIRDVEAMLSLLTRLGVKVEWRDENVVALRADEVDHTDVDEELSNRIRASFLLAGPLLARFGRAEMPPPGGDVIGRRRLDPHLDAFRALGATLETDRRYKLTAPRAVSRHATSSWTSRRSWPPRTPSWPPRSRRARPSSTTRPRSRTCRTWRGSCSRWARGSRASAPTCSSCMARSELGGADFTIGPDHIEVGSFIALAAVTGGELRVKDVVPEDLRMTRLAFERLGCRIELDGGDVVVPAHQRLRIKDDEGDAVSKIEDGPWPAFPADLTSIALAMATQAEGMVLIHEKMFENRLFFVDKLVSMGARVLLCDPHRAVVSGPSRLHARANGEPGHPRRHGHAHRRAVRGGHLGDRQHPPDRPRLRAHRRAPALARRAHRARRCGARAGLDR